jgi:hypothetical protein
MANIFATLSTSPLAQGIIAGGVLAYITAKD